MERRKALQFVGTLIGGTFISTEIFLSGCKSDHENQVSSEPGLIDFKNQSILLSAIGETIFPKTEKHPGFNDISATSSMIVILNDCYSPDDQKLISDGLTGMQDFSEKEDAEKKTLLTAMDKNYFQNPDRQPKFYGMLKEAALLSYFVNEKVMTKTLQYIKVPGKYDGEFKGDPKQYSTVFGYGNG